MARGRAISKSVGQVLSKQLAGSRPVFDTDDLDHEYSSDVQVMSALNWYSSMASDKKERTWFVAYMKEQKIFTGSDLSRIKDFDSKIFSRVGRYCQMLSDGYPIDSWALPKIQEVVRDLQLRLKPVANSSYSSSGPSVQDRMNEKALEYASNIQTVIDDFTLTIRDRKKSEDSDVFDIVSFVNVHEIKPLMANRIVPYIEESKNTWADVVKSQDPDIREGYSIYTTSQMNRIIRFHDWILEGLSAKGSEKKVRKPRKTKKKTPTQLVKAVQFLDSTKEYGGLKSIKPESIIGAGKLVMFNTKYREFTIFEASDVDGFGMKGTTLQGFDPSKSVCKRVREQYVKDLLGTTSKGIRAIRNGFKSINSKENTPTGRINKDCILVKVMK